MANASPECHKWGYKQKCLYTSLDASNHWARNRIIILQTQIELDRKNWKI